MTGVCWSISFPRSIMVCYCPLSVLSVPESILNEGQLHLAAIFQLSPRYHGDMLVFFDEPGCEQRGACTRGEAVSAAEQWEQRTERNSGGTQARGGQVLRTHASTTKTAISNTLLICRGADSQEYAQCFDFHTFQPVSLHPSVLLSQHPLSCNNDSNPPPLSSTSAALSVGLLETMMN